MKRLFHLMIAALASAALFSGCQKYDDTQIRQEIKDLGERIAALEAWTRNSQEAIDYVAVLKEAVKNMNSIESVNTFEDGTGSGYVITFTNKQTIKLYNGQDGDTFFGNVNVGSSCVEFTLADGTSFFVDRVTNSIGFDSFVTKTIARGDTIWTVMNEKFTKSEFAAFTAEIRSNDGTAISVVTKSASEAGEWKIESIAPEFNEDGSLARPAGVVIADAPEAGAKGVLKVALVTNNGKETSSSLVIEIALDYLSFRAVEAGATVSMEIVGQCEAPSLEYSTNLKDWTTFDFSNPQTITLENVGDKVYWKNKDKTETFSRGEESYVHFVLGEKKIAAKGNIMSLVDSSCVSLTIPSERCFQHLFENCGSLTQAPELPATTLAKLCYFRMFCGCSALETAPELPAKNAVEACYARMFQNCTSLKAAPELPAEEMGANCYQTMFANCTSLKTAPDLPAPVIKKTCYFQMFAGCTSLEVAPVISFKKADSQSCYQMFAGCTSLKKAPDLPAEELEYDCYGRMFEGCTALEEGPAILPAKQLNEFCYYAMFYECSSLELAPELPATELAETCYYFMFGYCTSLESAPKLPATELAYNCYADLFVGCTSLKDAPELPASKMKSQCYGEMFALCTSLETAPALPATELADLCYISMFEGCTSLVTAPELPATNLAYGCYANMFRDCTSLETAPELPVTKLEESCYDSMFFGCTALTEAPELPAEKLAAGCYVSMFDGCSNLKHIKVGFNDWGDGSATAGWVAGTPAEGNFECPEGLSVQYGGSYIPAGWSVNGVAPTTTKSFAAPATRAAGVSHHKPHTLKIPEIQDRIVGLDMIAL